MERRTSQPVISDQEVPNSVEIVDINNEEAIYNVKNVDKIKDDKEKKRVKKFG